MKKIAFIAFTTIIALSSCVSKKQYNDMLADRQKYYNESMTANRELADKNVNIKELNAENDRLKAEIEKLEADTLKNSKTIYSLKQEIDAMKNLNTELANQLGKSKSEEEIKLLLADLQKLQESLQAKEDELKRAENQLSQSQASLNEKRREIEEQQQKLKELTEIIEKKENAMSDLKNRVSHTLVGYEGNGLSVTQKGGKVYISLDEQLLFQSGRWDVDPRGVVAIQNLSKLLAENPDIHVLVEGHTDDIPFRGSGQILDNWDLSVKRATAIVRIILQNKDINPVRTTAAGRSQYLPIDPAQTPEARQKNRRTEIILSPNLDELMELLSK